MFRPAQSKIIFRCQGHWRKLSTQAATKPADSKFQEEWNSAKPYASIPAMTKLQSLRAFLPGGKYHQVSLIDLHKSVNKEYGNITKFAGLLGRPDMVMTYNVEDAEKVFRFDGQYPYRRTIETMGHYRKKVRPDIYGEFGSLLTEQDERWYKMRTLVNPVMLKPTTIKLYVPQVDEVAKEFIEMIMQKLDNKSETPANFNDYLNQWSLESIACITLNRRLGLFEPDYIDENAQKLIQRIREFFVESFEFEINPPVWKYYETKSFKKLMSIYDDLTNIVMIFVDEAVEEINSKPHVEGAEESILEKLLKINKKVAVVMCADALIAGVDTTSSASIGILYCLAKNQDKQELLREELRRILPNKDDPLTPDKMRNMPYLRAVIKEGIRLYPPTSGNIRRISDDLVLSGYQVPKGTEVVMGLITMHTDEKQFAQAQKFIPERWLKNNVDPQCPHSKDAHPFAYLPFGFGSRMCVGRRLAELEIEVLVSRIIRDYKIEWNHPDMKIKSVLVNIPDGDLKFKFTKL